MGTTRFWIVIAGVVGALGIAIGAFGAHGLPTLLAKQGFDEGQIANRIATFEVGARYHMYAALTLLGIGCGVWKLPTTAWTVAGGLMLVGITIFSGLCYALALTGEEWRWLGAVVPLGGLAMIGSWVAIAIAGWKTHSNYNH